MTRPLLLWPDPRLSRSADPVDDITNEIRAIWDEMIEVMDAMPGVGLAAPQLGINLRLAVVDASPERGKAIRLANPEVVQSSQAMRVYEESSPNLPGLSARVKRPSEVSVSFVDHTGLRVRQEFEGLWATSVQHQIDHLNGELYLDRLSRTKRDMLLRKLRKGRR